MAVEVHMNENRQLLTALTGFSEESKYDDVNNLKNTVNDNWNEAVTPWKAVSSHPRYYPYQTSLVIKRKPKPTDNRVPDWQKTSSDGEAKQTVRCVGDELDSGSYLHWKGMVEQVTYRYVPHNGYYRTMKFLGLDKREWFTVNKKQPEQVSMSWQSKRYQKELKRQLKREFEKQNKRESDQKDSLKLQLTQLDIQSEETCLDISEKQETRNDQSRRRAKSTKSSDFSKRCQKDQDGYLIPEIKSAPLLPGDLYKSRSDLYIENISSRINALEKEIANDTRLRKPQEDPVKQLFRPKGKEKGTERDVTPRPYKKESLPEEVFTAKSIGTVTQELKPPEKLNPITRLSTASTSDSKSAPVTQLKYTTSSGNNAASFNLPTLDLEKTLNSYKMAIENTRQSLLTTLNGKQMSRRTITSKNYSSPTTITICDNGSDKGSIQDYIQPLKGDKRFRNKKEPLNGVAALLPEIAGKRLEVPTTTHRWL